MNRCFHPFSSWLIVWVGFLLPLAGQAEIVERVVAVVNEEALTVYDLDRAVALFPRQQQDNAAWRRQVLEDLIRQKLLEQEITRAEIEVSDEDLARAVAGVLQRNQMTIDQLRSELSAKGISFESYKEQLKNQIRQTKFFEENLAPRVQITPEEVERYQKKGRPVSNSELAEPSAGDDGEVRLQWIFLPLAADADAKERRKLVYKGRDLADRARQGEDFGRLVRKYSKDKKGKKGGERQLLLTELPQSVAGAVQKMEPGAISDPIAAPEGIYVVKLVAKTASEETAAGQSEEAAWQQLFNQRMEQEIHNYLMQLRRKAYVEIFE